MNATIAAAGKLDKGIVRTPPEEFLHRLEKRRGAVCVRKPAKAWVERKADPFDYSFDKCPI